MENSRIILLHYRFLIYLEAMLAKEVGDTTLKQIT